MPEVEFSDGYDPTRGRYKRYAEQLAAGHSSALPNEIETKKARRAWCLYVPKAKRKHLRSIVRAIEKSGKYLVRVEKRVINDG